MKAFPVLLLLTATLFSNELQFPFSVGLSKLGGVTREQTDRDILGLKAAAGVAKFIQPSVILSNRVEVTLAAAIDEFGTYQLSDKLAIRKNLQTPLYLASELGLNYQTNIKDVPSSCGFLSMDCGMTNHLHGGFVDHALYASLGAGFGIRLGRVSAIDFNMSYPIWVFMHDNIQTVHWHRGWDDSRPLEAVPEYDTREKKALTGSVTLTFGW